MSLLPTPNTAGNPDAATGRRVNNIVQNQPTSPTRGELTLRLDHNAGEKRRLFGRFTRFSSEDPVASVLPFDGIGMLGRNTTRNPREVNFDLAVARRFRVGEHVTLTLRGEAFNLLNHVNLNGPDTGLSVIANAAGQPVWNSPNFGLITSAKSARFMQIVARIDF